jgi:predicted Zn-dependent peptidase
MNVEVSKISIGIKLPLTDFDMDARIRDLYLFILFNSLFGATSSFNEKMKDEGILFSYAMIDTFYTEEHLYIVISADTSNVNKLLEEIKFTISKLEISDEDFENKKKVLKSSNIYVLEDVDAINARIVNDLIIYGKYDANLDEIIDNLSKEELSSLIEKLDFSNTATVVINPLSK